MKLSINDPCHKDWNKMLPNEQGAFCLSCKKNVIDFTSKTVEDIKTFFIEKPASEEICARVRQQQFHELDFEEFINEFMSWQFMKRAAVICFLVLGATLFNSCTPKKPLVGTVQVVDEPKRQDTLASPVITSPTEIIHGTIKYKEPDKGNTKQDSKNPK